MARRYKRRVGEWNRAVQDRERWAAIVGAAVDTNGLRSTDYQNQVDRITLKVTIGRP